MMTVFFTQKPSSVTVDGRDALLAVLTEALNEASEVEAPGLRRAVDLVRELDPTGAPLRVSWAGEVLSRAGVDPQRQQTAAVRELRRAAPDLNLAAAVELARAVKERGAST
jgi:hypothetical protein